MPILDPRLESNLGRLDRSKFRGAHNASVFTQSLFSQAEIQGLFADALAYPPCWAILDPGMCVEAHQHIIAEFYVFINGKGNMRLGEQNFPVESGMSVNIPSNVVHEVSNSPTAIEPLIWVSIGLKEPVEKKD